MHNILSIVELLRKNPHCWAQIFSSAYGVNLDSRVLDKVLYAVDSSDKPL